MVPLDEGLDLGVCSVLGVPARHVEAIYMTGWGSELAFRFHKKLALTTGFGPSSESVRISTKRPIRQKNVLRNVDGCISPLLGSGASGLRAPIDK